MQEKIKVFVNKNLDGAGCLLVLKWALSNKFDMDVEESDVFEFPTRYESFQNSKSTKDYSKVFVLNLHCGLKLAPGTIIINKDQSSDTTSSIVALNALSGVLMGTLSQNQVRLIKTISDFYTESEILKDSWKLHAIFSSLNHSPVEFSKKFVSGLSEYGPEEKTIIREYKDAVGKAYINTTVYESKNKNGMFIGMCDDIEKNRMLFDILFKIYHPKVFFLINLGTKDICIRKDSQFAFDLSLFCGKLIDGYAFRNMAGGKITEKFVDFSKDFIPCKEFKTK